jgi:hypothetical protein
MRIIINQIPIVDEMPKTVRFRPAAHNYGRYKFGRRLHGRGFKSRRQYNYLNKYHLNPRRRRG